MVWQPCWSGCERERSEGASWEQHRLLCCSGCAAEAPKHSTSSPVFRLVRCLVVSTRRFFTCRDFKVHNANTGDFRKLTLKSRHRCWGRPLQLQPGSPVQAPRLHAAGWGQGDADSCCSPTRGSARPCCDTTGSSQPRSLHVMCHVHVPSTTELVTPEQQQWAA